MTEEDALRAYARMMNCLDSSHLEPWLVDDFRYASQWVFDEIGSKAEYLEYIRPKLETIRQAGAAPWAEIGWLADRPCVVMAQGDRDNLLAVVLAEVASGKILRIDLCAVPAPQAARRTGEYPGRVDA